MYSGLFIQSLQLTSVNKNPKSAIIYLLLSGTIDVYHQAVRRQIGQDTDRYYIKQ